MLNQGSDDDGDIANECVGDVGSGCQCRWEMPSRLVAAGGSVDAENWRHDTCMSLGLRPGVFNYIMT
jgi:hypothetical protein